MEVNKLNIPIIRRNIPSSEPLNNLIDTYGNHIYLYNSKNKCNLINKYLSRIIKYKIFGIKLIKK